MLIKRSFIYLVIMLISLLFAFLYLFLNDKKVYYENELMVIDHNNVVTYLLKNDLNNLDSHNKILIDNKDYKYNIKELEIINGIEPYYKVVIELNNNFFKNSFYTYKVLIKKENLLKYFIRLMKG